MDIYDWFERKGWRLMRNGLSYATSMTNQFHFGWTWAHPSYWTWCRHSGWATFFFLPYLPIKTKFAHLPTPPTHPSYLPIMSIYLPTYAPPIDLYLPSVPSLPPHLVKPLFFFWQNLYLSIKSFYFLIKLLYLSETFISSCLNLFLFY